MGVSRSLTPLREAILRQVEKGETTALDVYQAIRHQFPTTNRNSVRDSLTALNYYHGFVEVESGKKNGNRAMFYIISEQGKKYLRELDAKREQEA